MDDEAVISKGVAVVEHSERAHGALARFEAHRASQTAIRGPQSATSRTKHAKGHRGSVVVAKYSLAKKSPFASGIMVCLYPVAGTTPWSQEEPPHLTLVYAGKVGESDVPKEPLSDVLSTIANAYSQITVPTMGLDTLGAEGEANVVRLDPMKQLAEMRFMLDQYSRSQHKGFKPHVTIDNLGEDGGMADDDVPDSITFDRVALHYGEDVTVLPLGQIIKYNPYHDKDGRFTTKGNADSTTVQEDRQYMLSHPTQEVLNGAQEMLARIKEYGGFTLDPLSLEAAKHGYSVGMAPDRGLDENAATLTASMINRWRMDNADLLSRNGAKIGGWLNTDNGHVYLDVVRVFGRDKEHVARLAAHNANQIAMYNLDTGSEIMTGGDGTPTGNIIVWKSQLDKSPILYRIFADSDTVADEIVLWAQVNGPDALSKTGTARPLNAEERTLYAQYRTMANAARRGGVPGHTMSSTEWAAARRRGQRTTAAVRKAPAKKVAARKAPAPRTRIGPHGETIRAQPTAAQRRRPRMAASSGVVTSGNDRGNPYHDKADGRFTSAMGDVSAADIKAVEEKLRQLKPDYTSSLYWADDNGKPTQLCKDCFEVRAGGLHSVVTRAGGYGNETNIEGNILDENNRKVGRFERTLGYDNNPKDVHHSYLTLDPKVQGSAFGAAFFNNSIAHYAAAGFETVSVEANIDVGGYAWAKAGFNLDGSRSRNELRAHVLDALSGAADDIDSGDDKTQYFSLGRLLNAVTKGTANTGGRVRASAVDREAVYSLFKHPANVSAVKALVRKAKWEPRDLAAIGANEWVTLSSGVRVWLGKAVMIGSSWGGTLPLNSIGKNMTSEDALAIYTKWMEMCSTMPEPRALDRGNKSDVNVMAFDLMDSPDDPYWSAVLGGSNMPKIVKTFLTWLSKANKYHKPGGSRDGGQFTTAAEAGIITHDEAAGMAAIAINRYNTLKQREKEMANLTDEQYEAYNNAPEELSYKEAMRYVRRQEDAQARYRAQGILQATSHEADNAPMPKLSQHSLKLLSKLHLRLVGQKPILLTSNQAKPLLAHNLIARKLLSEHGNKIRKEYVLTLRGEQVAGKTAYFIRIVDGKATGTYEIKKYNPFHEPGGSPIGGRFAMRAGSKDVAGKGAYAGGGKPTIAQRKADYESLTKGGKAAYDEAVAEGATHERAMQYGKLSGPQRETYDNAPESMSHAEALLYAQTNGKKMTAKQMESFAALTDKQRAQALAMLNAPRGFTVAEALKHVTQPPRQIDGYHVATDAEIAEYNAYAAKQTYKKESPIPPGWVDVQIANDWKQRIKMEGDELLPEQGQREGYGRLINALDFTDKSQPRYSDAWHEFAGGEKYDQVKVTEGKLPALDKMLAANAGDPAHDCLALIRATGIRPDSGDSGGRNPAFGATSLLKGHVSFGTQGGKEYVRFQFPAKDSVQMDLRSTNPALISMLKDRTAGLKASDPIFGKTNVYSSLNKLVQSVGIKKVYSLRTHMGTTLAMTYTKAMPKPRTRTEYAASTRAVAEMVSKSLGNTWAVCLQSYIAPSVFDSWNQAELGD